MSSVNKILLWICICNFISYTVMYSFVEFESSKKWLVLALLTCRFLTFAIDVFLINHRCLLFLLLLLLFIQLKKRKASFDRQAKDVFVELEELSVSSCGKTMEWKEKARWIKFEENVDESADRWNRPQIAMLSFHRSVS